MYIGIDLGGTNIAIGIVNNNGKIIIKGSVPTKLPRDYTEIVKDMADLSNKLISEAGILLEEIKGIGVGCPGLVDRKKGEVVHSNNLQMHNTPIAKEIQRYFDLPVSVLNDADAAAFGEYTVNGNDAESFVFVTLGTGVGGGLVLDKKLYTGTSGAGSELGHITLVHDGLKCNCGNIGCWEAYASVTALIRQTTEAIEKNPESLMKTLSQKEGKVSGRTAFDAAKSGDAAAQEVVKKYCEYVASGLVSIINIFQPEKLVIGGGISKEGDYLLNPIKEYCGKHSYNNISKQIDIAIATLFNDAGIIGAALACKG